MSSAEDLVAELGYATADEELMVNELLAYMATETRLFGGPGPAGGRDRRRGPGGGKGGPGGDRHAELRAQFTERIESMLVGK